MKSEEIVLLNSVSAPAVHPEGNRAVASVIRPDFAGDAYVGQLWEIPLNDDGGMPRRLTRGFRDTAPKFAPDGGTLAFLRAAPGEAPQLFAVESRGGEPVQLTDRKLGVTGFAWSSDSASLVFAAPVPEEGRYGTVEGVGADAEDARLITGYKFRLNGAGYTNDKRAQLFRLAAPDLQAEPPITPVGRAKKQAEGEGRKFQSVPEPVQLTHGAADHQSPQFSADGGRIYFSASLHAEADSDLVSDIYSIDTDGLDLRKHTNLPDQPAQWISADLPAPSPDGRWLFFLGSELGESGTDFVARNTGLYVAPTDTSAPARRLTDAETIDLSATSGELVAVGDDAVVVLNSARGAVELLRLNAAGELQVLVDGRRQVTGTGSAGGSLVASFTDPGTAGDVGLVTPAGLHVVTDFSAALRAASPLAELREETFTAADGYPVHGWVLLPEGEGPHPVLLTIHGGPFAQYGWGLFDEAQVYVAAGYAVLMCNPRGAAGYGQAHGRAIKEAMGTVDLVDVLAFLEGAQEKYPQLDRDRMGVMGGSYGGYLTAWAISQDHRFAAAIIERGYLDPPSFVGSSDIGWFFSGEYTGTDEEGIRSQNPFAQIGNVGTPSLIIHSEEDLRCPLEQAHRYYVALKQRGVPAELLIFPGENHELSRTGTPWHRKQRFDEILRWWANYLPTARNQPGTPERSGEAAELEPAAG
ncbi:S9 family peptidase [Arthrobacter crystallopoietes]|uniref:Dipeptidyl aminopeptidase/acylaminoacyl peptidase n=1 Tax=Crystallibacter crystallopoietes TaxID=37928 RepID=A0A1H1GK48_9MICC|nr:S9 family peptidase [Arthrobacter crystallopoietes]AUI52536.1 peptidase S9 [Arthrobacter crystallopoietes]SDR13258.1 Dipeptidyl aminopeptidase/acylaminoacyl peptidase [Arthrobacter crystallopoietes]